MSDTFNKALAQAEKLSTQDNAKSVLDNIYSTLGNIDPPLTIARKLGLNIPSGEDLTTLVQTVAEGVSPGTDIREIVEGSEKISEGNVVSGGLQTLGGLAGVAIPFSKQIREIGKVVDDTLLKSVKPLDVGVDESLLSGKFLKNYTENDFNILDDLVNKGKVKLKGLKANKLLNAPIEVGRNIGVRLNLNSEILDAPKNLKPKLQTIHEKTATGKALSYKPYATVVGTDKKKVKFYVSPSGRENIATGKVSKHPAMSVNGAYEPNLKILPSDPNVVEIGFNPKAHHLFIDLKTGQAVKEADAATVIGDRVYAKGVTYFKKSEAPKPKTAPSQVRYKEKKKGGQISTGLEGIGENTIYRANGGGIDINYEGMEDIESETIESEVPSLNTAIEVKQRAKPAPVDSENVGGETPEEREQREFSNRIASQNFAFRDNRQNIYNQFANQYSGEKDPLDIFNIMSSTPMGRAAMAAGAGFGSKNEGSMGVIGNYIDQMSGLGQFAIDSMVDPLDLEDAEFGGKTRGDILGELINEEDKDDPDEDKVKGLTDFVPFEKLKNPYENIPMVYRYAVPGAVVATAATAGANKLQDWSGLVGEAKMAGERVGIDRQGNIVPNIFLKKGGGGLSSLQEMPMVYRQTNGQVDDDYTEAELQDAGIDVSSLPNVSDYDDTGDNFIVSDERYGELYGKSGTSTPSFNTKGGFNYRGLGVEGPKDDTFATLQNIRPRDKLTGFGSDLPLGLRLITPGAGPTKVLSIIGNAIGRGANVIALADTFDNKPVAILEDGSIMYISPEHQPNYDKSLLTAEGDTSGLLAPKVKGVKKFKKELEEVEKRYSKKPTKRKNVFEIALLDQIYGPGVGKTMVG